jgi:hypothetical protein
MNLSDGVGDALVLALLNESKETTPCTVCQMKKGAHKKKEKKTHRIVP